MPVAGGTAYVAMDEEGGNIFGASTTLGGVGLSFSSKLEALEEELSMIVATHSVCHMQWAQLLWAHLGTLLKMATSGASPQHTQLTA